VARAAGRMDMGKDMACGSGQHCVRQKCHLNIALEAQSLPHPIFQHKSLQG